MTTRFRSAFSGSSGFVAVGSRARVADAPVARPPLRGEAGGSPLPAPSSFSVANRAA